ncbi:MAG: hypothetical protein QM401_07280 [Bacillota bacterium]|nr:hypothetical protein [Bacillota bacterium]
MILEVVLLVALGFAISFMFYASYMRDKVIELKNNEDILVACLEKSATKPVTNAIEEVCFVEGWNAGLKAAINLTEEVKKC